MGQHFIHYNTRVVRMVEPRERVKRTLSSHSGAKAGY